MKDHARRGRAFRPAVLGLEDRTSPAGAVGVVQPLASVATVPAVGTGNAFLPADAWMSLHRQYAARARAGGNAVVVLGDSLAYLWGDPHRKAPPDEVLHAYGTASWDASLRLDRAANFGIVGDQTQNVLWRVENGELAGRPKVAVVMVGVNNLINGQSPDATAAGIAAVVGAVRDASPTTKVLVLGILPATPNPADPLRAAARAVNARLAGLTGDGVTVLDPSPAFLQPDGTLTPGLVQAAGVHLTEAGYQVLASVVQPVVRSLLSAPGPHAAGHHSRVL